MADSDDESERRRSRDKFRRERSDYDNRRRPGDKREPFDDRASGITGSHARMERRTNSDLRQFSGGVRDRHSPTEPPYKRQRREFSDDFRAPGRRRGPNFPEDESMYRPPLMPFKRFLEPLDDFVTDTEACQKYREYKESFMKRYIEEFFEAHKSEEWLRLKYHPDFVQQQKELATNNVRNRLAVFMDLLNKGYFDNQSVQMDNSENLIKLMDSVVIKLEGGTDEDLKVLEDQGRLRYHEEEWDVSDKNNVPSIKPLYSGGSGHKSEEGEAESDIDGEESDKCDEVEAERTDTKDNTLIDRSRDRSLSPDASVSNRSSSTESSPVNRRKDEQFKTEGDNPEVLPSDNVTDGELANEVKEDYTENPVTQTLKTEHSSLADDVDDDDVPTPTTAEAPGGGALSPSISAAVLLSSSLTASTEASAVGGSHLNPIESNLLLDQAPSVETVTHGLDGDSSKPTARPLHKTASIFFRALPPSLTMKELEEVCSVQPGFLRLAMWDPVPERRFMRHAWSTYKPDVNIKKICWALNTNPTLREKLAAFGGEVGATVNRDLAQRVRPLTPLTRHKPIMRQDLMLAARLIMRLDSLRGLWRANSPKDNETQKMDIHSDAQSTNAQDTSANETIAFTISGTCIESANPLLRNLTDHLVDEGGGEEEALLAGPNQPNGEADTVSTQRSNVPNPVMLESDPELANALDRLILYLRIVHSVDFYSGAIYPMEDMMPHRCGILHARGDRGLNTPAIGGRSPGLVFSQREIDDYLQNFNAKLRTIIEIPPDLTDEEMRNLGMRDPEKVAEEFIEANIQKRTGKKKPFKVVWVCPLSDKKFREPIFVRKHILNKHMDRVEAVKKDNAVFFNNYLRDPRRPSLPEAPLYLASQYYPPSSGVNLNNMPYRGLRGQGGPRMGSGGASFRGSHRPTNNNPATMAALLPAAAAYGARAPGFQDYYDAAAVQQQQQQQAMAAVAAAAAAALYPNPAAAAADLYALAANSGSQRGGVRRRGMSPGRDLSSRPHHNGGDGRRRPPNMVYGGNRRRYGSRERGVISYTDLDAPGREAI